MDERVKQLIGFLAIIGKASRLTNKEKANRYDSFVSSWKEENKKHTVENYLVSEQKALVDANEWPLADDGKPIGINNEKGAKVNDVIAGFNALRTYVKNWYDETTLVKLEKSKSATRDVEKANKRKEEEKERLEKLVEKEVKTILETKPLDVVTCLMFLESSPIVGNVKPDAVKKALATLKTALMVENREV